MCTVDFMIISCIVVSCCNIRTYTLRALVMLVDSQRPFRSALHKLCMHSGIILYIAIPIPFHLIYKAEIVCVHYARARFLLHCCQTCCTWLLGAPGISVVDVTRFAVGRELSVHFRFFLRGRPPFSNYF